MIINIYFIHNETEKTPLSESEKFDFLQKILGNLEFDDSNMSQKSWDRDILTTV